MGSAETSYWTVLERWSPTLFVLSGGILVLYATAMGLWAFTDLMPRNHGLEIGYAVGFLGLLGLYPAVARRSPWLARIGAVAAGCGIVAIIYVSVNDYVHLTGLMAGNLPGWTVFRLLPLVGFIIGYLSFGIASLSKHVFSPIVGILLLVPGVITILMLASILTGHPLLADFQVVFVVSAGEAMAHLAIGTTLRSDANQSETADADPESDAEVVARE